MSGKVVSLNGDWAYKMRESSAFTRSMTIPCNWEIGGLHDYSGEVWFERRFELRGAREDDGVFVLKFKGVDYFADVWLNGKYVGSHEGYFQPFEFNVTKYIKLQNENVLIVKVNSPKEDLKNWPHEKRYIKGVFGHHDIRPGSWSPKYGQMMGTGGIWNDVELEICEKVRVKNIKVSSELSKNYKRAKVKVEIEAENSSGRIFRTAHTFSIKNPRLWWTWDLGEQNLYIVEVSIGGETRFVRFGIREIKRDKKGNWLLNGKRIFVRGTNIIPEEYLSKYNNVRIKNDIKLLREANVNAVRVHAHVNRKELYEAFDEAGIMAWQDFALQWEYQDTPKFGEAAVRQPGDMVNHFYNHPSIVLWCCHNEPIKSKKKVDRLLYSRVKKLDRTRLVLLSSDFDEHPYPGWFWGKKEYFISRPGGTLPSEFGAMALPKLSTLKKMFRGKDLWPPNWLEWAKRDFTYEQMFHIAGVPKGKNLHEFIANTQEYQAKLIKFVVEHYRLKKFIGVAGLFHFMFLEPWPCISYSVVDYFRNPKAGFQALMQAYQPVLAVAGFNREIMGAGRSIEAEFYVLNDYEKKFNGLKLLISLRKGAKKVHSFRPVRFALGNNCCKYLTPVVYSSTGGLIIPKNVTPGKYSLVFDVYGRDRVKLSSNSYDIAVERIPKNLKGFNAHFAWE